MKLHQKNSADCAQRHGCEQNVDFEIPRGEQAGGGSRQKTEAENQERATRAGAADKEPGARADGDDEE